MVYIYPENLKAAPTLWLWQLRDLTIGGALAVPADSLIKDPEAVCEQEDDAPWLIEMGYEKGAETFRSPFRVRSRPWTDA